MHHRTEIVDCGSSSVRKELRRVLEKFQDLFPVSRDARILIKPNLNSYMNALTGNTTDLRILGALIHYLKEGGYSNITIGEGTNSGFYRCKIGIISRLKIDRLAGYYGVKVKDLNYAEPFSIPMAGGCSAEIARDCIEADFLINLPKLKTHFEMGMSACLKNLMGCMVGQKNKKAIHESLAANILYINEAVKPQLHIVDGLIAMEGTGPTRGTPLRLETMIIGANPFVIDLICARIAGFDPVSLPTLRLAKEQGKLTADDYSFVESLDLSRFKKAFAPPSPGLLARIIHHPDRQKYFLAIRNTPFFTYLAGTAWFGKLLFLTGLRQDVFTTEEMKFTGLSLKKEACDRCGICERYCPIDLPLPASLEDGVKDCLGCLYCYMICPRNAVEFEGEPGFVGEQIRQYGRIIRDLHREGSMR